MGLRRVAEESQSLNACVEPARFAPRRPGILEKPAHPTRRSTSEDRGQGPRYSGRVTPACLRINVWSGPRNVSTALMYSFAQRADTRVVDEPLYAHYLRVTGAEHPGRDEVLAAQENDGERVVRELILGPCDREVLFFKQMAHHLVEIDHAFLAQTKNVILTRDPEEMLTSLVENLPQPTLRDTGFAAQSEIVRELRALGQEPHVLLAHEILLDPHGELTKLSNALGIAFDPAMLSWPTGPRAEDGVWAPYWYANVHRSSGFQPYRKKSQPVPERLAPLLAECRRHYQELVGGRSH